MFIEIYITVTKKLDFRFKLMQTFLFVLNITFVTCFDVNF